MTDPDPQPPAVPELAEAERRCRNHADFLHVPGQDGLMLGVLLAEYDRRRQIEQRAREIAEANTSAPTKNPVAIRAARHILGESS